jgi:hypothetical protein
LPYVFGLAFSLTEKGDYTSAIRSRPPRCTPPPFVAIFFGSTTRACAARTASPCMTRWIKAGCRTWPVTGSAQPTSCRTPRSAGSSSGCCSLSNGVSLPHRDPSSSGHRHGALGNTALPFGPAVAELSMGSTVERREARREARKPARR